MKRLLKSALARTPYRVVRRTRPNRFQAVDETLASLRARGFHPGTVIDGGANVGEFTRTALSLFPDTIVHAVEPQPGCLPALEALRAKSRGRVIVHPIALCGPEEDGESLRLATDATAVSTGAYVTQGQGLTVQCRTLDKALAEHRSATNCALLKLDLQGYELHALRGATETLRKTDVILTEVSFYAQAYEPQISTLVSFLANSGFELYDVAAISARPRDDRPRQGDFVFVRADAELAKDTAWA